MRILLLYAIALAIMGIWLMLYGIGLISLNPKGILPLWVKIGLIVCAVLLGLILAILGYRLLDYHVGMSGNSLLYKGGIRL